MTTTFTCMLTASNHIHVDLAKKKKTIFMSRKHGLYSLMGVLFPSWFIASVSFLILFTYNKSICSCECQGACLALNAGKWSESLAEVCAFHNLPSPTDDERLPVGTGSNPVS